MPAHWNWLQRSIAIVVWASFLSASLATMVFFALIDPDMLLAAAHTGHDMEMDRTAIYTLGFFFFWAICGTTAGMVTWLIRTERRKQEFPTLESTDE